MRMLALSSLLLVSGLLGLAQDSTELVDKAPAPIEEALRARIDQYYHAFVVGKFKEAYLLVAEDSQDAFFEADKDQYKACETVKIRYSDNFTKAVVVESCKTDWKWHGMVVPATFPITSHWKIEDGKWCWYYVRPTQVPFPFSPTGFMTVPPADAAPKDGASIIPSDLKGAAQSILAKVTVDKQSVRLRPDESSRDGIHVHNGMPGVIQLQMDQLAVPGLKVTLGKTDLGANDDTTVSFDYKPDPANRVQGTTVLRLHVIPTGQTFSITVAFEPVQPQNPAPKQ
jgi:hypothetical protein